MRAKRAKMEVRGLRSLENAPFFENVPLTEAKDHD